MPPKVYVTIPGRDFRAMLSYIPSLNTAGMKIVNVPIRDGLYHMEQISGKRVELLTGKMKRRGGQDTVTEPAAAHPALGKGTIIGLPFPPDTRDCDQIGEK